MIDPSLESFLGDLLQPLGGVSFRRMFSGSGIYRDGLMFGLVTGGVLHFKADAETIPAYEAAGSEPFSYDTRTGRRTITSYWRVPEALFDEPDAFADWARQAAAVARRAEAAKAARPKRGGRAAKAGAGSASDRGDAGAARSERGGRAAKAARGDGAEPAGEDAAARPKRGARAAGVDAGDASGGGAAKHPALRGRSRG